MCSVRFGVNSGTGARRSRLRPYRTEPYRVPALKTELFLDSRDESGWFVGTGFQPGRRLLDREFQSETISLSEAGLIEYRPIGALVLTVHELGLDIAGEGVEGGSGRHFG